MSTTKWKVGKEKTGGRKKGTPNKKTEAWNRLGDFFTQDGAEKAKKIMMESEGDEYMKYYSMFLEYFKPKTARTEIKHDITPEVITLDIMGGAEKEV